MGERAAAVRREPRPRGVRKPSPPSPTRSRRPRTAAAQASPPAARLARPQNSQTRNKPTVTRPRPGQAKQGRPRSTRGRTPLAWQNWEAMSWPNRYPAPRGLSPHPSTPSSGSLQSRSHMAPSCGTCGARAGQGGAAGLAPEARRGVAARPVARALVRECVGDGAGVGGVAAARIVAARPQPDARTARRSEHQPSTRQGQLSNSAEEHHTHTPTGAHPTQTTSPPAPPTPTSCLRSMVRIWSRPVMVGDRPPCTQKMVPAETGERTTCINMGGVRERAAEREKRLAAVSASPQCAEVCTASHAAPLLLRARPGQGRAGGAPGQADAGQAARQGSLSDAGQAQPTARPAKPGQGSAMGWRGCTSAQSHTENPPTVWRYRTVDEGRQREVVKYVGTVPPDVDRPVLAQALVIEAVHLRDGGTGQGVVPRHSRASQGAVGSSMQNGTRAVVVPNGQWWVGRGRGSRAQQVVATAFRGCAAADGEGAGPRATAAGRQQQLRKAWQQAEAAPGSSLWRLMPPLRRCQPLPPPPPTTHTHTHLRDLPALVVAADEGDALGVTHLRNRRGGKQAVESDRTPAAVEAGHRSPAIQGRLQPRFHHALRPPSPGTPAALAPHRSRRAADSGCPAGNPRCLCSCCQAARHGPLQLPPSPPARREPSQQQPRPVAAHLECQQQQEGLHRVEASVHKVPHEQVVGLCGGRRVCVCGRRGVYVWGRGSRGERRPGGPQPSPAHHVPHRQPNRHMLVCHNVPSPKGRQAGGAGVGRTCGQSPPTLNSSVRS